MTKDRLNDALKRWATGRAADAAHLDTLARTIGDRLRDHAAPDIVREGRVARHRGPLWGRLALAGLGAVAAILILSLTWILAPLRSDSNAKNGAREFGTISASELRTSARLFRETNLLFDGTVRWVANTDKEFRVGLAPEGAGPQAGAHPLLVRVVILSRKAGQAEWRRVWRVDVFARAEDQVDVPADAKSGNEISLWLYPMADGSVLVDSAIELPGPAETSYETSGVLTPGRPASVLSVRTNGDEFKVLQTVVDLAKAG